jgi:hypothetical protein
MVGAGSFSEFDCQMGREPSSKRIEKGITSAFREGAHRFQRMRFATLDSTSESDGRL